MKNKKLEFFKCKKCGIVPQALIEDWSLNADQPFAIKTIHLAPSSKENDEEMIQVETVTKLGAKSSWKTEEYVYCFECHQPMKRCKNLNIIQRTLEEVPFK